MKASISYGLEPLLDVSEGQTATLKTKDTIMKENVAITVPIVSEGLGAQADWLNVNPDSPSYILNKPTLGELASKNEISQNDLDKNLQNMLLTMLEKVSKEIFFIGTKKQYNEAYRQGKVAVGTIVIILDNEIEWEEEDNTTAELGKAILGLMVLGR